MIDGEIEACQVARQCLDEAGYTVRTFSSGEVIAQAEEEHPQLMLISLIHDNARGIPPIHRELLVKGRWVDGSTLPWRHRKPGAGVL